MRLKKGSHKTVCSKSHFRDDNQNQACVCQLAAGNEAEETFVEPPPLPEKRLRKQSSFIRPHKSNPPLFDESCVTVSSGLSSEFLQRFFTF